MQYLRVKTRAKISVSVFINVQVYVRLGHDKNVICLLTQMFRTKRSSKSPYDCYYYSYYHYYYYYYYCDDSHYIIGQGPPPGRA